MAVPSDDRRKQLLGQMAGASERMSNWKGQRGPIELMLPACCPIPATHDKLKEAHYFLHQLIGEIHRPDPFRWSLNAFLQAARSVPLLADKELKKRPDYATWKVASLDPLYSDTWFSRVKRSRNFVVHERMLDQRSKTMTGVFRGRQIKLGVGGDNVPNNWYSEQLLHYQTHVWTGFYIAPEHPWIGEQFGVKRDWRVAELGDEDAPVVCDLAYATLVSFVQTVHECAGGAPDVCDEPHTRHDWDEASVLLESDLDPELPRRWGWIDKEPERPRTRPTKRR